MDGAFKASPRLLLLIVALLAGCETAVQYPPGSSPSNNPASSGSQQTGSSPSGSQNSQTPARSNRASQHVMESMAQGAQWGGLLAGPFGHFGALGGMVIGAIYGFVTVGAEEQRVVAQVNKEAQKDQQLEALIEKELERQRALEGQIAGASTSPTAPTPANSPATTSSNSPGPRPVPVNTPAQAPPRENTAIASISKPAAPTPPPTPFKNVEVRDINGDGIPDLWIYYNPQKPAEIVRQEESTKGDGRVDTWSYFKDGKLLRREVDKTGEGRPTTVFYYDQDKIVREERDEMGQGRMTYRGIYENGRLAKVERDSGARGRPDSWIYYDVTQDGEIVLKEERDLNGDGIPDMWTYYEAGRVVRRDVSAAGLEVLAQQEQLPAGDLKAASLPKN